MKKLIRKPWNITRTKGPRIFTLKPGVDCAIDIRGKNGHFASVSIIWMQQGIVVSLTSGENRNDVHGIWHEILFLFPGAQAPRRSIETRALFDGNSCYLETPLATATVMVSDIDSSGAISLSLAVTAR